MTIKAPGSTDTGLVHLNTTRRGLLKCSLWAGTGILWTVMGGVPQGMNLGGAAAAKTPTRDFTFVQISDSHIGFKGDVNPTPGATLQEALARVQGLTRQPAIMIYTGDVTQLSKPEQFDTAQQIINGSGLETYYVPGEHDVLGDDGKLFFERLGRNPNTGGWYSFDEGGVHFVALINVFNFKAGGLGALGDEQIQWLAADLKNKSSSTPIVVFAHMPLWSIYPDWGWGTADAAEAFSHLKRFGSVTVLNGHIHQTIQKVEGHLSFHTAMSTAFPQSAPGQGPGPGPMPVPAERLRSVLGVREVDVVKGKGFTVTDSVLSA